MTEAATTRERWLFGPLPDLLFGCGLLYVVFFVGQSFAGPQMRHWLPYALAPFLTLLLGTPHYGATLLRVYERRQDRQRYALFAVWATILMAGAFVAGLYHYVIGSVLVTLYFTWSPWHYSGQNYGIAVLFLRRRRVPLPPLAKRALYGTFILSYGLVFLSLHGLGEATQQVPANVRGTVYAFLSLGIPSGLRNVLALGVGSAYLACLLTAARLLRREASWRDLGPTATLVGIQALWFLVPATSAWWSRLQDIDPFAAAHRPYAFLWIATGHFVQYLWISVYYSAASERTPGRLRFLAKALLAGTAIWTLPALLFAPGALGRLPSDFGLALLAASVVNLHHFVLDGVIWKLRDGPVARVLLRAVDPGAPAVPRSAPPSSPDWRIGPRLGWTLGATVLALSLFGRVETYVGEQAAARGDWPRFKLAAERRAWLGGDSPRVRLLLAQWAERAGDLKATEREVGRSLDLFPTEDGWLAAATLHERRGRWREAIEAYREVLALDEDHVEALLRLGRAWLALDEPDRAREALERAAAIAPENRLVQLTLQRARGRSGSSAGSGEPSEASPFGRY